jgi:hypothetical protein
MSEQSTGKNITIDASEFLCKEGFTCGVDGKICPRPVHVVDNEDGSQTLVNQYGKQFILTGGAPQIEDTFGYMEQRVDGSFLFTNADGTPVVIPAACCPTLTAEADGSFTFLGGDGVPVVIPAPVNTTSSITGTGAGHIIGTHDNGSGTTTNIFETITSISLVGTSIEYAREDAGTDSFDLCPIVKMCETLTSLAMVGNNLVFQNELGVQNSIPLPNNNFLSAVDYDDATNVLTFTMVDSTEFDVNLTDLVDVGSTSVVTPIVTVGNVIATHADGGGNTQSIRETVTTLSVVGTSLRHTNELGTPVDLDLCPIVKSCETLTSVNYNATTGVFTFTDENGDDTVVNFPLENFLANAAYDDTTNILTLTMTAGNSFPINLSDLVDSLMNSTSVVTSTNSGAGTQEIATHSDGAQTPTTVSIRESITEVRTSTVDAKNLQHVSEDDTITEICQKKHTFGGQHFYEGEMVCDPATSRTLIRHDFSIPSDGTVSGLGPFQTDFAESVDTSPTACDRTIGGQAPHNGQMFAEGIYRVMASGCIPTPDIDTFKGIHSDWLNFMPYSSGYGAFNMQPSTGAGGQRVLYTDVSMTAGNCYTFRMKAMDTHTQAIIDAQGIDLADVGLVVGGAIVDNTGMIGATATGTDGGETFELSFVAATTGVTEMALISNNAATNGNDIFIDYIELVEQDMKVECLEGTYLHELDCDGDKTGTPVKVDINGDAIVGAITVCEKEEVGASSIDTDDARRQFHVSATGENTQIVPVEYVKVIPARDRLDGIGVYVFNQGRTATGGVAIGGTFEGVVEPLEEGPFKVPFPSPDGYQWTVDTIHHALLADNNTNSHTEDIRILLAGLYQGSKDSYPNDGTNPFLYDTEQSVFLPAGNPYAADVTHAGKFLIDKADEQSHTLGVQISFGVKQGVSMPNERIEFTEIHTIATYTLTPVGYTF